MDNSSLANPISSFGNSFSTGFLSSEDSRWRWEGRRGLGGRTWITTGIFVVYLDFCGIQPSKEQKLRKRLYMLISRLTLTVILISMTKIYGDILERVSRWINMQLMDSYNNDIKPHFANPPRVNTSFISTITEINTNDLKLRSLIDWLFFN